MATKAKPQTTKQTAKPGTAVATKGKQEVGEHNADLLKMMEQDSGKGVSTDASDNIVPLIYILQSNSPGLQRADAAKYLGKEAKAGDIWFRGTKKFVAAELEEDDEGLLVVPCHFSKCWIEWRPDRGGFVARHAERPKDAQLKTEKREGSDKERQVWRMPNGNSVQETREYVVLVLNQGDKPLPYVIPMTSTNHTPARQWMSSINEKTIPGSDKPASIYSYRYRIFTSAKTDGDNNWYVFNIVDGKKEDDDSFSADLLDDLEVYRYAKRINDQFTRGELRADVASDIDENDGGETGDGAEGGDGDGM